MSSEARWKKKRTAKRVNISASQVQTFQRCRREWWLNKVRGISDGGTTHSQAFGTVLHAVCERYLLADDLGRGADGELVCLYPSGWHKAYSKYTGEVEGELSLSEQSLVKALIDQAIQEGVLVRVPGRKIEHEFKETVIVDEDGTLVVMVGFIDMLSPGQIDDHKTSKSPRWLLSAEKLKKNPQARIYAASVIREMRRNDEEVPETITLRHNQFLKESDARPVRFVEVEVPTDELERFWDEEIKTIAAEMLKVRKDTEKFTDIPMPEDVSAACNAYGGCSYRPLCYNRETIKQFEKRIDRKQGLRDNPLTPLTLKGGSAMDLKAKIAQKQKFKDAATKAEASSVVDPAPAETKEEAPELKTLKVNLEPIGWDSDDNELFLPPWVNSENPSTVNDGLGFNDKGAVDQIADFRAGKNGLPTSEMFDIEAMPNGTAIWIGIEGTPAEGLQGRSPLKLEAVARGINDPVTPDPEPTEAKDLAPEGETVKSIERHEEITSDMDDTDEDLGSIMAGKAGRPRKSLVLLINCVPQFMYNMQTTGDRKVWDLNRVLESLHQHIAEQAGVESVYELDVWDIRKHIARLAPGLVPKFQNGMVCAASVGQGASDLRTLVDALTPEAGMVVRGVSG